MCYRKMTFITRFTLIIACFFMGALGQLAHATLNSAYGIKYSSKGDVFCPTGGRGDLPKIDSGSYFKIGACTINAHGYVPVSGQYRLGVNISLGFDTYVKSNSFYVDASKDISTQAITVKGSNTNINGSTEYAVHYCYTILDQYDREWSLIDGGGCGSTTPLPPTPPPPVINCSINNYNAINVNLGTLDRALLPTVPGTGQPQNVQIPVSCTSDSTSATSLKVNMKLNYTPITVSGLQVIKSSSNGVGVSVIYNGSVLAPSVDKPVDFIVGSNIITLGFEAVRDPNVALANIPASAFTASAVLVMTVQ